MRTITLLTLLLAAEAAGFAQLTAEQKLTDFRQLAGLLNKRYAPYEWKKQAFGFDLRDVQPWLDRVARTANDLDFYEVCVDYLSSLRDAGTFYLLPSTFRARLGFSVDVFEDRLFVVFVDRALLPASEYPFDAGDEVISFEGRDARYWLEALGKYQAQSSPRAAGHLAAAFLTDRSQQIMPRAVDVGDRAAIVVRRRTGAIGTYSVPWVKTGQPLAVGPVPPVKTSAAPRPAAAPAPTVDAPPPSGPLLPQYPLPDGFAQRLGRTAADAFLSGVYPAGGKTIGYLRIGTYIPATGLEMRQLDAEIAYFQQNTDGLVVDNFGTPGGSACFAEDIAARFISRPFRLVGYRLRATRDWISTFEAVLNALVAQNAPQAAIGQAQANLEQVTAAYQQDRGLTPPLPLCGVELQRAPSAAVYTKPFLLLINERTVGPAENLAAMLQDAGSGVLFGTPTGGVGSANSGYAVGSYAEGYAVLSTGVAVRPAVITTSEYPATDFIENAGVRPDVYHEAYTLENLAQLGRPFANAFTRAILNEIAANSK
jgi:hypothetical protein